MVESFNLKSGNPGSGTVPITLEVNHVDNVAIQGHLQSEFHEGVRALGKAVDTQDLTSLLLNCFILNLGDEVVKRSISLGFGSAVFAQNLDTVR